MIFDLQSVQKMAGYTLAGSLIAMGMNQFVHARVQQNGGIHVCNHYDHNVADYVISGSSLLSFGVYIACDITKKFKN